MFDVELYRKMSAFQKYSTKNCLEKYKHLIKWVEQADVIDIGCGEGSTLVELLKPLVMKNIKKFNLVGVDLKDDMIEVAKKMYHHIDDINFYQMNIACIALDDRFKGYFDNVFSFFCLHLVVDLKWIENIYDLMKPGAQAFLVIPTKNPIFTSVIELCNEGVFIEHVRKVEKVFGTPFAQLEKPENWIVSLMEKAGYRNIKTHTYIQDYVFPNFNNLKEFIQSFGFLLNVIPENMQENFLNEMTNRVIQKSRVEESKEIHANCGLMVLIADK